MRSWEEIFTCILFWSAGSTTVAEMAQAAKERRCRFIAITDHTKGLKIANGLNESDWLNKAMRLTQRMRL